MQTNNSNISLEILKLWQDKTQEFFSDPKALELMLNNMQLTQSFFAKMQETIHGQDKSDNNTKAADSLYSLRDAIEHLNARIAHLEQRVSSLETNLNGSK